MVIKKTIYNKEGKEQKREYEMAEQSLRISFSY